MKFFKLSGAALIAVSFIAALSAAGAYGIATAKGEAFSNGCVSESGAGCDDVRAMDDPRGIELSNDGSRVFVAATTSDAVAIFVRDRVTGLLEQLNQSKGCISEDGTGGACGDGRAMDGTADVTSIGDYVYWAAPSISAIGYAKKDSESRNWIQPSKKFGCISDDGSSPDGADTCLDARGIPGANVVQTKLDHFYVGADNSIGVFERNRFTGRITQLSGADGCINDDGSDGCANGYVPDTIQDIYISVNGKTLYAAASGGLLSDGAVLIFSRDLNDGTLTQIGCVNDDGSNGCTDGVEMKDPTGLESDRNSGGGNNLYVAASGSNAIGVFGRSNGSGLLTQIGCVSETGVGGCADGHHLLGIRDVAVYKTNQYVYVTAGDNVANFSRNKKTGVLTQLPGASGCISETGDAGACFDGDGLTGAWAVLTTGGGKDMYVTGTTLDSVSMNHLK